MIVFVYFPNQIHTVQDVLNCIASIFLNSIFITKSSVQFRFGVRGRSLLHAVFSRQFLHIVIRTFRILHVMTSDQFVICMFSVVKFYLHEFHLD